MELVSPIFTIPRQSTDINLLQAVTDLLTKAGHPDPTKWLSHPILLDAHNANPRLQRFLINRFWRIKLGGLDIDTVTQRYCLFDEGPDQSWLETFDTVVVSTIVTHQLG
jgi:hypothetical protein